MGTRGFMGFVEGDEVKVAYVQFDAYPEVLGLQVLDWARTNASSEWERIVGEVKALRMVNEDIPPTEEDRQRYAKYSRKGGDEPGSWYWLLRGCQTDLALILEAGVMLDAKDFPLDSLWAEWGYLVNVTDRTLEAYRGFQHTVHTKGRFARPEPDDHGYYPVALVKTWSLDDLPFPEVFIKVLEGE